MIPEFDDNLLRQKPLFLIGTLVPVVRQLFGAHSWIIMDLDSSSIFMDRRIYSSESR